MKILAFLACAAALALNAPAAHAQPSFPSKPIRLIVPFAPGSGSDNSARVLAQKVSERSGWAFIIDNKPGGNGLIGMSEFLRAAPDGHTLVFTGGTTHGVNSALYKKLPYDPIEDFVPIAPGQFAPMVLLARPGLKANSAADLLALIRANPGKMSAATGSSFQQLTVELFKHQAALDFTPVSYKGSAQSMSDLIGGHVDFTFVDAGAALPQVRSGTLKPLAVTASRRIDALPGVPTMAEAGLPDIKANAWAAVFGRKGTPAPIVEALRKGFNDYLRSPEHARYLGESGGYFEPMSPEQMTAFIRAEVSRAQETLRRAGIQPE